MSTNSTEGHPYIKLESQVKPTKIIIRIMLLSVMVILGLIIVFPKSLDLMDMVIAEHSLRQQEQRYSDKYPEKKAPGYGSKLRLFFTKDVAPSADEIAASLLSRSNMMDVLCIGKIPKIIFDEDSAKISPANPTVEVQFIARNVSIPILKTGWLTLKPVINYIGSGMPIAQWLGSNDIEGWSYQIHANHEQPLSETRYQKLNKKKLRRCD